MIDQNKPMARTFAAQNAVMKALANVQPNAALRIIATKLDEISRNVREIGIAYNRIEHGDFAEVLRIENIEPREVEDLDRFNALVVRVMDEPKLDVRMAMCRKTLKAIRASIDGWQSKIDRMKGLSERAGSTSDEVATATMKITEFEFAIKSLRERGEIISRAHDEARHHVEAMLNLDARQYKAMYVNHS